MEVKLILIGLTVLFTISCLFFGTKNGFYDTDNYHGGRLGYPGSPPLNEAGYFHDINYARR